MRTQHTFPNPPAVAEAFAAYLVEAIASVEVFHLALSGGSTPKLLFDALAQQYAQSIDWSKVHLYWGDERCVPPTDGESNYGMTDDRLLQFIDIPTENVHRMRGEDPPMIEAQRYGQLLIDHLPLKGGLPIFDMIILGMGADGHTASIFPHQIDLLHHPRPCAVASHPETGQQRITLTGRIINAARSIHFLVPGANKKAVLKEIFNGQGKDRTYPAAWIENAEWWLDE